VITNGTAILGLGNLGALASKPVMEGKAVLFKRFADIDSIDLEVDTEDPDAFINAVRYLGPSFGGINLEDIKAPECFIIEQRLKELMDIPVFHDDQHGTAIIAAAGLLNALQITGRDVKSTRLVVNGAGAAAIACVELLKAMGFAPNNVILCDTKGAIYKGRTEGMNQWKSAHAADTTARTLADAMKGADVFFGLSAKGALTPEMVASMAPTRSSSPWPTRTRKSLPEEVAAIRDDAIMATGRSDYPNQVNNVLGFPYIFRGALDVRATTINMEMKIAAAGRWPNWRRRTCPTRLPRPMAACGRGSAANTSFPVPFDPRLMAKIPSAVARAAMETGVARKPIEQSPGLRGLAFGPARSGRRRAQPRVRAGQAPAAPVVFAEGEEEVVIRAASPTSRRAWARRCWSAARSAFRRRWRRCAGIEIRRTASGPQCAPVRARNGVYAQFLYERLQRKGFLFRDCQRLINQDRNYFAASMVAMGDADAMVTGLTRNYSVSLSEVRASST
jgi:malate dehydrogenase (oxaloacetate-decarboxylating)(NADP+)